MFQCREDYLPVPNPTPMRSIATLALLVSILTTQAQFSNISCTDPAALLAMKGLHDPASYAASDVINDHGDIICELRTRISADSLKAHLQRIAGFGTRHTYSDTVSPITGIGAARRWAFGKFEEISAANEGRLIPAYLQFDYANESGGCGNGAGWKNVLAVLPGANVSGHKVVLIEAHFDSRCADNCDPACNAPGAEDNGSGSALVIELARAMSKFTFKHTLVFMLTTGEEHGLLGARAMAQFCVAQGIAINGVLNNDVVGGILCGHTASPPGCTTPDAVDSLQLRIFSHADSQGFARMMKLSYQEKLRDHVDVPMLVSVMDREDRIGRGGDHIPFREAGFKSIRFTAANEHGDGDPTQEGYDDRQHTSDDLLGVDTDGDLVVDSFFVDFNYLQRNAVINGMGATLMAHGPAIPTYSVLDEPAGLRVVINGGSQWVAYRIGVRSNNTGPDLQAIYRTDQTSLLVPGLQGVHVYYVSVAGVDAQGITSPFGIEQIRNNDADTPPAAVDDLPYGLACAGIGMAELNGSRDGVDLLPCQPNPFSDVTNVQVRSDGVRKGTLIIRDIQGRIVHRSALSLQAGVNSVEYRHQNGPGVFVCEVRVDDRIVSSERLVALK